MGITEEKRKSEREQNMLQIASINRIKDFNIEAEAEEKMVGNNKKTYLPISRKKAWFRLRFPQGVIRLQELWPNIPDDVPYKEKRNMLQDVDKVMYQARVYESKDDDLEAYIGEGIGVATPYMLQEGGTKSMPPKDEIYSSLVLLARGLAESRALYNAGFGLQFYGDDIDILDEIAADPQSVPINRPKQTDDKNKPKVEIAENVDPLPAPSNFGYKPDEKSPAEPEKEEKKRKINRRTYAQKYDDAADTISKFIPEVVKAQKIFLTADNDILKASAKSKIESIRKQWDEQIDIMMKAVSKSPASNPVRVRKDLQTDLDALLEQTTQDMNRQKEDFAMAEMVEAAAKEQALAQEEAFQMETEQEPDNIGYEEVAHEEHAEETGTVDSSPAGEMTLEQAMEIPCTFHMYEDNTYGELYDASKEVLLWLMDKVDEEEKEAIMTIILSDEILTAKAQRKGLL